MESAYKKLDNILVNIRGSLFVAKSSYEVYLCIDDYAAKINKRKRFAHIWGMFQMLALDSIVLNLCKIFDKDKSGGHEQNSMSNVIRIISATPLPPKGNEAIKEFLIKHGINFSVKDLKNGNALKKAYQEFLVKEDAALRQLYRSRDKRIAHSDHGVKVESTASLDKIETIIRFGWEMCETILLSYCNVSSTNYDQTTKQIRTYEYLDDILVALEYSEIVTPENLLKWRKIKNG